MFLFQLPIHLLKYFYWNLFIMATFLWWPVRSVQGWLPVLLLFSLSPEYWFFFKPSFLTSQNSMDSELMTALACNQSGWGINPASWCYLWIKFVVGSQSSLRRLGWACSQPSGAACRGDSHLQSCHGYLPAFLELYKVPRQLSRLQLPSWPLLMVS